MNTVGVIFLILSLTTGAFCKHVRIVGGKDADITNFPYSVSIRLNDEHFCGGAIITEWNVLTAAHCIADFQILLARIIAGTTDILNNVRYVYTVHYTSVHPQYTGEMNYQSMNQYDIGIIKTNEIITFNRYQKKVRLPTEESVPNEVATLTGWGATNYYPEQVMPGVLQKAQMHVLDNQNCARNLPFTLSDTQMCVFEAVGVGACIADSGSPLVSNRKVIGISSFVHPCAQGAPDIFTRVYSHLDYINSIISA